MSDSDFSELRRLARDLGEVPANTGKWLRKALEVSARNVKDSAKNKVSKRKHWGQAAGAIDYDVSANSSLLRDTFGAGGTSELTAEIGYNKELPNGKLGNLVEFGGGVGRGRGLAPGMELQSALQENEEDFAKGIENAIDDALNELNL